MSMNIRSIELPLSANEPFQGCKLDRKKYADTLVSIIENCPDGFVMSINNEWGTGKTTFVKMLNAHLERDNYRTLYFNAWENDFDANPMIAIMSELKTLQKGEDEEQFNKIIKNAGVLLKAVAPAIAKGIVKKYTGIENLESVIEEGMAAAGEILSEEIKKYSDKKNSIKEFKKELQDYICQTNHGKPLIFIIDELDRCKPDYAVEVLENVKHFFSVKGIVFILAIDKVQLGHAIQGYYGSCNLNVEEYLRRFIDIEYSIPEPDYEKSVSFFLEHFRFNEFFINPERKRYHLPQSDYISFVKMNQLLFKATKISLRNQEKFFVHARVALKSFNNDHPLYVSMFVYLLYLKTNFYHIYQQINKRELELQDLLDQLAKTYPSNLQNEDVKTFFYLEAMIVCAYYRQFQMQYGFSLFEKNGDEFKIKVNLLSCFDSRRPKSDFQMILKSVEDDRDFRDIKLEYLLNKINLVDPIAIG